MIVLNSNDINAWRLLLNFAANILGKPHGNTYENSTLASIIRKRTTDYLNINIVNNSLSCSSSRRKRQLTSDEQLSKTITSKIEDGNISAALRILLSDDKPAEVNEETLQKLLERHPPANHNRKPSASPSPNDACLQVIDRNVITAIRSFPAGSSGGSDGLRPQHIIDLISCKDAGPGLLTTITAFINLLFRGQCPAEIIPILFGGNLTALTKKSGGIRPIAVGYYWRRLTAKCANTFATAKLAAHFAPIQLGVGVPGGCEAAVHACRRFLLDMPEDHVIVKLDFTNAFNCLRRDIMLDAVLNAIPEIYTFCHMAYNSSTMLKFGDYVILSQEGVQQGDPLGPLIFCLSIHPLLRQLSSHLVVGFMDDITIGGPHEVVTSDVRIIKAIGGDTYGVHLNDDKCEMIYKSETPPAISLFDKFSPINVNDCTLLGAPLCTGSAMDSSLMKKAKELRKSSDRLQLISAHDALVLLRASCGAPMLMHILRSSPCAGHQSLAEIDSVLRSCLSEITNVSINDQQWTQANLPIKAGGLGIRSVVALALPAFLSSCTRTRHLQNELLHNCTKSPPDSHFDNALAVWCDLHQPIPPPTGILASKQRLWDNPSVEATFASLLASQQDDYHKARLLAVSATHSGDWLFALPISSCGLRLEDDALRIAIGLRLGASICEPHQCVCGSLVTATGSHCLSCKHGPGKTLRHNYLNDIIYHSLRRAGIPATKEPAGLLRSDGKRPDGLTTVPWKAGKSAVWDVTVADTLATSYLSSTAVKAGSAAEIAASRKENKYAALSSDHIFVPLAFESLGPVGTKASSFLRELGRRLIAASDDTRESSFLFQRLSMGIQRFNAVCFSSSFRNSSDAD
jgi:hypothetical protein